MRHFATSFLFIVAVTVLAAGLAPSAAAEEDGLKLYKANCRVCHEPDSPNGEYTPMTLIQSQWERFFDRKYERKHEGLEHPESGGKKVLEAITPEMLEKIRAFAVDHAADSEHPMTCGK